MEETTLQVGHTYYRLTFADCDLTMPGLEPMVYLGDSDPDGEEPQHFFQDTVSYSRFRSRFNMSEDHDEVLVYLVPSSEIGTAILGIKKAAAEVAAAAQRAESLRNPTLPVLKDGWQRASN